MYIFLQNGVTCVTCYILLEYVIIFVVTKCYVQCYVLLRVVTCSNFIQVDANFSLNQYAHPVPSITSFAKHFGHGVR